MLASAQLVNGQPWPDADGQHINAHGGCILKHGDTYYWYGEQRPDRGSTMDVGISVYSSKDLAHWHREGVALSASSEAGSDIERGCIMERPKVLFCPKTQRFVILFHLELKGRGYEAARVAFAESDSPTGPFRFLRSQRLHAGRWPFNMTEEEVAAAKQTHPEEWKEWWTPAWRREVEKGMYLWRDMEGGQMSRDMTVFVDDDGRAYHITSSQENLTLLVSELTDDYLDYTGRYVMVAPGGQNEAPCIFRRMVSTGSSALAVRDGHPMRPACSAPLASGGLGSSCPRPSSAPQRAIVTCLPRRLSAPRAPTFFMLPMGGCSSWLTSGTLAIWRRASTFGCPSSTMRRARPSFPGRTCPSNHSLSSKIYASAAARRISERVGWMCTMWRSCSTVVLRHIRALAS